MSTSYVLTSLLPSFSDPNRRLCVTLCPQEMAHFSENHNASLFTLKSLGGCRNEVT